MVLNVLGKLNNKRSLILLIQTAIGLFSVTPILWARTQKGLKKLLTRHVLPCFLHKSFFCYFALILFSALLLLIYITTIAFIIYQYKYNVY